MVLRIPNRSVKSAALANIAEPEDGDWQIAGAAHLLEGVREARTLVVPAADGGCAVTAGGLMTVDVAAGIVTIDGLAIVVAAVTGLVVTPADGTNPRFDLVVVNNSGVVSMTDGSPSDNPVFPAIPVDSIVLATVYVSKNLGTILDTPELDSHITDKRVLLREPRSTPMIEWGTGSVIFGLPGWELGGFSSLAHQGTGIVMAVPIYVARRTTYDRMAFYSTTAGGVQLGLGIYTSVDNGQGLLPERLIVDVGAGIAATNTLVVVTGTTFTLDPGYYFAAGAADGAITLRTPQATTCHVVPVTGEGLASAITGGTGLERIILFGTAASAPVLPDPFPALGGDPLLATNGKGYGFWLGRTLP